MTTYELELDNYKGSYLESVIKHSLKLNLNIDQLVNYLKADLPNFLVGRGGSHIWISTRNNFRVAIIK